MLQLFVTLVDCKERGRVNSRVYAVLDANATPLSVLLLVSAASSFFYAFIKGFMWKD